MTTAERLQVAAIAAAAATAALAVVIREVHAARIERKRSQPIVIAHERKSLRLLPNASAWGAETYLTNDGGGNAFNVRFGIELRGARFPYRYSPEDDPPSGSRERVVRVGETYGDRLVRMESIDLWGTAALRQDGKLHTSAIFWCQYENASGDTWETRNPVDRAGELTIRRVRFRRIRAWREQRGRRRATRSGERLERTVRGDLAGQAEAAEQGDA